MSDFSISNISKEDKKKWSRIFLGVLLGIILLTAIAVWWF